MQGRTYLLVELTNDVRANAWYDQYKAFGPPKKSDERDEPSVLGVNRDEKLNGLTRIQAVEENAGT